jgi:hypothetical protein
VRKLADIVNIDPKSDGAPIPTRLDF